MYGFCSAVLGCTPQRPTAVMQQVPGCGVVFPGLVWLAAFLAFTVGGGWGVSVGRGREEGGGGGSSSWPHTDSSPSAISCCPSSSLRPGEMHILPKSRGGGTPPSDICQMVSPLDALTSHVRRDVDPFNFVSRQIRAELQYLAEEVSVRYFSCGVLPLVASPPLGKPQDAIHHHLKVWANEGSTPHQCPCRARSAAVYFPQLFVCGSSVRINSAVSLLSLTDTPYPSTCPTRVFPASLVLRVTFFATGVLVTQIHANAPSEKKILGSLQACLCVGLFSGAPRVT